MSTAMRWSEDQLKAYQSGKDLALKPVRKNKYNAVRVGQYDSKKEAQRGHELSLLEQAGKIEALEHHPIFPLSVNGVEVGSYEADFVYVDVESCKTITEDVKGVKTDVYRLKKKLMKAIYNIDITEV
jgi:hypothetical protein